jgi:hypothetical protein
MFSSLLPSFRELRTPLASGYLWLLDLWLVIGDHLPRRRPVSGPVAQLWDLSGYFGKGMLIGATVFAAYLVGSLIEINPLQMWDYGGRPAWLTAAWDGLRRLPIFSGIRILPMSSVAVKDLTDFTIEDLDVKGATIEVVLWRVMAEEAQLATRLQATNPDLFGRYDRVLAESTLRLNVVSPLLLFFLLLTWQSHLPWLVELLLTIVALLYSLMLFRQAAVRAIQSRDVLAQALIVGVLESRAISRRLGLADKPDETAGLPGQGSPLPR